MYLWLSRTHTFELIIINTRTTITLPISTRLSVQLYSPLWIVDRVAHCHVTRPVFFLTSSTMVVFQIVLSLFAIILLSILPVVLSSARKRRMLRNMPGMKEVPVLGHALYYLNKSPAQIMDTVWRAFGECGRVWKMFLLHDVQVVVSDPKVCEVSDPCNNTLIRSKSN